MKTSQGFWRNLAPLASALSEAPMSNGSPGPSCELSESLRERLERLHEGQSACRRVAKDWHGDGRETLDTALSIRRLS